MGIRLRRTLTIQPVILALFCLALGAGCSPQSASPEEPVGEQVEEGAQPYFGLEFPTSTVTRFAPSIFREELHSAPIFTPDGREVYFSLMNDPGGVRYMKIENGAWTDPAPAPFDRLKQGDSPFISPDGGKLLFLAFNISGKETIRQVERKGEGWSSPRQLPDEVNQHGAHWQASLADNGNLYFSNDGTIYFSAFENGTYQPARRVTFPGNSSNFRDGTPFIAPDESYLIFNRSEVNSYADLFITFREAAGDWGTPIFLHDLNTAAAHELYANVSPDGRFLIFLSNRAQGILLPYWVDAGIIEELRESGG